MIVGNGQRIALLGSTGSIGVNTLDVVRCHPDRLSVSALAAGKNWKKLARQIREFRPRLAVLFDGGHLEPLREAVRGLDVAIMSGMDGLLEMARDSQTNVFLTAVVGSIGLQPVLEAINAGKTICLANKETLVVAGALVMEAVRFKGVDLLPVDSEHSAIFQCLQQQDRSQVHRLILTASGGPFRRKPYSELASVTPAEALKHPTWDMGGKITIDSATLMNKGLEVIEAHWLFGIEFERVEVLIHPQSVIHSMVEFVDGSIIGQMGAPDMRGPIQYALSHPFRWPASGHKMDFLKIGQLTFESPRIQDFPCLGLAFQAGKRGGTLPCVMNAANEIAVEAFLKSRIGFLKISEVIKTCMDTLPFSENPDLKTLLECDRETRAAATQIIDRISDSIFLSIIPKACPFE